MGCTARSNGCGEPTFFNDYQSAASHYSRSSCCNKSMRGIKSVAVQLNTRPQYVGDGQVRPEKEKRLARGAPNQRHHVAQVP